MRITNKIMQRNNLNNINTNKVYQDSLSTQMSTQKKISRASDDPVVAIRALRLRSNVTEVTQFYSKNIPDARSWLEVTESALKNQSQVMTDMISQCTKGANGDLTSEDRGIILDQLQALAKEVYSTANADYAGRYVFTGYRTDTPLSFVKAQEQPYEIKEVLNRNSLSTVTKVESGNVSGWTSANYETLDKTDEQSVEAVRVYRIQLAYQECSTDVPPTILVRHPETGEVGSAECTIMRSYETDPSPYKTAQDDDDAMIYVPETGEILLGKNAYQTLMEVKDDITTSRDEGQIQIIYQKDTWNSGDLRPEHYFSCKSNPGTENEIEYNYELADGAAEIYAQLSNERENLMNDVNAISEKYPDADLMDIKTWEQIVKLNEQRNALSDEDNALIAEKSEAGTSAERIAEIDERLSQIPLEYQDLSQQIDDLYDQEPAEDAKQLLVDERYMADLNGKIADKWKEIRVRDSEKSQLESENAALATEYETASDARKAEIDGERAQIEARIAELDGELEPLRAEHAALVEKRNDLQRFNEEWDRIRQITDEMTYLEGNKGDQSIEYDVGFNQTIRVNSTAGECFQHGIGRTVDDIVAALQEVTELDNIKTKIKTALDAAKEGSDEAKILKTQYQAADKAVSLAKDKTQKMFESAITTFQKYLDDVSLSITNCGNRSKKLELIENRMQEQKTTFETLRSENEDVDIAETAIQLTSAQLTYEAALMATGKVSQNSLLQYI